MEEDSKEVANNSVRLPNRPNFLCLRACKNRSRRLVCCVLSDCRAGLRIASPRPQRAASLRPLNQRRSMAAKPPVVTGVPRGSEMERTRTQPKPPEDWKVHVRLLPSTRREPSLIPIELSQRHAVNRPDHDPCLYESVAIQKPGERTTGCR